MAITKKFKVTLDVTVKLTTEMENNLKGAIRELAQRVAAGDPEVNHKERELLVQALTHGPDGAVAFAVRQSVREGLRDTLDSDSTIKVSPATVRVVS